MAALYILMALFIGQINAQQSRQAVHLQPHRAAIDSRYGGKMLELINSPPVLTLPTVPPKQDSQGRQWSVDVKNLGPGSVTITGKPAFSVSIDPNQTVHIYSNGDRYLLKR